MKIYQRIYPGCADDVEAEIMLIHPTETIATDNNTMSTPSFLVLVVSVVAAAADVVVILDCRRPTQQFQNFILFLVQTADVCDTCRMYDTTNRFSAVWMDFEEKLM